MMGKHEDARNSLDTVSCCVHPYGEPLVLYPIIDREKISQTLTKDAVSFLASQGINVVNSYTPPQFGAAGGNFWLSLIELIKDFRILKAVAYLVGSVSWLNKSVTDYTHKQNDPTMFIDLSVSSNLFVDKSYYDDVSMRLGILMRAGRVLGEELKMKYPLYSFKIKASIRLVRNDFEVSILFPVSSSEYTYKKMCNIASNVTILNGTHIKVSPTRFGLYRHVVTALTLITDSPHHNPDYRYVGDSNTGVFYTLLTENIKRLYTRNKSEMRYDQYYKKYLS